MTILSNIVDPIQPTAGDTAWPAGSGDILMPGLEADNHVDAAIWSHLNSTSVAADFHSSDFELVQEGITVSTSPIDFRDGWGFTSSSTNAPETTPKLKRKRKLSTDTCDKVTAKKSKHTVLTPGSPDDDVADTTQLLQLQIVALHAQQREKQRILLQLQKLQQELRRVQDDRSVRSRRYISFLKDVLLVKADAIRSHGQLFRNLIVDEINFCEDSLSSP